MSFNCIDLDERRKEQCPVPQEKTDMALMFEAYDKAEKAFAELKTRMNILRYMLGEDNDE